MHSYLPPASAGVIIFVPQHLLAFLPRYYQASPHRHLGIYYIFTWSTTPPCIYLAYTTIMCLRNIHSSTTATLTTPSALWAASIRNTADAHPLQRVILGFPVAPPARCP